MASGPFERLEAKKRSEAKKRRFPILLRGTLNKLRTALIARRGRIENARSSTFHIFAIGEPTETIAE